MIPEIVAIGDSLTQLGSSLEFTGWVLRLQQDQQRKRMVTNHGYSGYTTKWIKRILPKILQNTRNPVLYTVFLGANDACLTGTQTVSVDDYYQNLKEIIATLCDVPVILITPPPVVDGPCRINENTIKYRNTCIRIAQELTIPLVDTWNFITEECLCDGLHFNELGNRKFYDAIVAKINELLKPTEFYFMDWKLIKE
jgi:lysophospholipase L1-like esterase